jgi:hypothetical protein
MKKLFAILFTTILLLTSCAITSNSDKIVRTTPSWVNSTPISTTTISYVISATGVDESDAFENACNSFVDSFTSYLSISDKAEEYKESLIATLSIADYNIYNTARFFENDGEDLKGYFLFIADKSKVNERLTVQATNVETSTIAIQKLELAADNYYKSNKDYKALNSLVDAYIKSRENSITAKYINQDDLLEKCVSILSKTVISVSDFKSDELSCTFEVTRQVGLFPPNVVEPKLKISYSSYNAELKPYIVTERIALSSKNNSYQFVPHNKTAVKNGVLIFETDIDEALYKLENAGYLDAVKILETANKSYLLSYKTESIFKGKSINLSVFENDLSENPLSLIDVSRIVDSLEGLGAIVNIDENSIEDSQISTADYSVYDYQITFKNEVTEKLNEFKSVVRTAGSVEVADLKKGTVIYASDPYETITNADTSEIALKDAFNNFALKGIFLIKENF